MPQWDYHMKPGAPGDTYAIWQTGESFEVKVLTHQSSTNWHTAHGSLEGILERKVHISFDNNAEDTGTLDASCDHIEWHSGGVWSRQGAAPLPPGPSPSPPPTPGPGPGDVDQAPVSVSAAAPFATCSEASHQLLRRASLL